MRISFQFNKFTRFDVEFGYNTPLFSGMYWFSIITVYLGNNGDIEYADLKLSLFKHYKYWFRSRYIIK